MTLRTHNGIFFSLSVRLRNIVRGYNLKSNDPDFHEFEIHNYKCKMSHYKVYTVHLMIEKVQMPTLDGFRGNVVLGYNPLR